MSLLKRTSVYQHDHQSTNMSISPTTANVNPNHRVMISVYCTGVEIDIHGPMTVRSVRRHRNTVVNPSTKNVLKFILLLLS